MISHRTDDAKSDVHQNKSMAQRVPWLIFRTVLISRIRPVIGKEQRFTNHIGADCTVDIAAMRTSFRYASILRREYHSQSNDHG